ncbi:hypothetical protein FB451DRAFT_1363738 [Mycena latifolia]|nr:hypothetical protein FB451DRAFT_1363738 [Mycena latifolia]
MGDVYNDSAGFIEDRNHGSYHERRNKSRWSGALPQPTFVFGINAPLDGPIPPFGGFIKLHDYPGDNPASTNSGRARRPPSMTSASGSIPDHCQDDARHWESDTHREDVLRHRAMASRECHPDELEVGFDEHVRYNKRPRHDERGDKFDRARFHAYSLEAEDRLRTHDDARMRYQATGIAREHAGPLPLRTQDSPDLRDMPCGPDGHPQSTWAVAQDGPEPPEDVVICPPADPDYVGLEELRISRVRALCDRRDGIQPRMREHNQVLLGAWYQSQVQTLEQAYNVAALLAEGQQETYEFFRVSVQNLAAFPRRFRTEGEAFLMCHQQELERVYWTASTGQPRISRTGAAPAVITARAFTVPRTGSDVAGPAPTPPPAHFLFSFGSTTAANATPPAPALGRTTSSPAAPAPPDGRRSSTPTFSDDPSPGYLGNSPADPSDPDVVLDMRSYPELTQNPNTRWTVGQLMYAYVHRHPNQWGLGIRGSLLQLAVQLGNTPAVRDVLAYHTCTALSPGNRHHLAHQYRLFFDLAIRMFLIRGLFDRIISLGGYPAASLPMAHYPYLTDNVTMPLVAAWFIQHGIVPASQDVAILESFARVRRNMAAHIINLSNAEWTDMPRNGDAVAALTSAEVPRWADLHHAPLADTATPVPTVTTTVDASISGLGGLSASVHAPMLMEVELTPPRRDTTPLPDPPSDTGSHSGSERTGSAPP